jgi:hypothetical protein
MEMSSDLGISATLLPNTGKDDTWHGVGWHMLNSNKYKFAKHFCAEGMTRIYLIDEIWNVKYIIIFAKWMRSLQKKAF